MIPKVIHYCWFGRNPLPRLALKCIESWKKYFPGYEIKEWNEDNFDVNAVPYTRDAYAARKYAFVSDYARYWILFRFGGVYFDTDVEVIRPMEDLIEKGPFMGIEVPGKGVKYPQVALGLGLGAEPGMAFYKDMLDYYAGLPFHREDGSMNLVTIVHYNTDVLVKYGMRKTDDIQQAGGIYIYPVEYFNPMDSLTGRLRITENTRSIHRYAASWTGTSILKKKLSRLSHRVFGLSYHRLKKCMKHD